MTEPTIGDLNRMQADILRRAERQHEDANLRRLASKLIRRAEREAAEHARVYGGRDR